jgi:hypothetical protein
MARLDSEEFLDKEVSRVYLAAKVGEAERVEKALTDEGFDFMVEIERFTKAVLGIFTSEYSGAGFYVLSGQADSARKALSAAGLTVGLQLDDET